ncbi:UrcA family protein [Phenylobacterium sp.]|jgi:UrcA family protein|uniref:UrcA family protein n=1 Tax=Phenylobacterium sp. TaxID=1871053 RepID=UPI002F419A01
MTHTLAPIAMALAVATTFAGAALGAPLRVVDDSDLVTAKVAYADSELHSADGARAVAQRIRTAAWEVCGGARSTVRSGVRFQQCRSAAIDRALATLSAPMVSEAAGRKTSLAEAPIR